MLKGRLASRVEVGGEVPGVDVDAKSELEILIELSSDPSVVVLDLTAEEGSRIHRESVFKAPRRCSARALRLSRAPSASWPGSEV
jgi:hypothetical protein